MVRYNCLLPAYMCKSVVVVVPVLMVECDVECEGNQVSLVVVLCLLEWSPVE